MIRINFLNSFSHHRGAGPWWGKTTATSSMRKGLRQQLRSRFMEIHSLHVCVHLGFSSQHPSRWDIFCWKISPKIIEEADIITIDCLAVYAPYVNWILSRISHHRGGGPWWGKRILSWLRESVPQQHPRSQFTGIPNLHVGVLGGWLSQHPRRTRQVWPCRGPVLRRLPISYLGVANPTR
jgi:hypothetical protein